VWVYPKVLEHDALSPKKLSEAMDKGPRTFYFKQEKMEKMQKQAESKGWIMVMEDDKVILVDPTKILVKEEE
jgi:hypothetical protein